MESRNTIIIVCFESVKVSLEMLEIMSITATSHLQSRISCHSLKKEEEEEEVHFHTLLVISFFGNVLCITTTGQFRMHATP